jgi:type II secretory pathway component GspD/PulD (secretin)
MVLDVKPTVSNDRRFVTVEVQPTVAELLLPIPTFTTTLGPTSTVTIQIPEIKLQTAQTTVRVPDGGAVVIAGLKTVRDKYHESGVPILSDIPLLGVLFRRQGRNKEQFNLVIVVHAKIIDLNDEELRRPGWNN